MFALRPPPVSAATVALLVDCTACTVPARAVDGPALRDDIILATTAVFTTLSRLGSERVMAISWLSLEVVVLGSAGFGLDSALCTGFATAWLCGVRPVVVTTSCGELVGCGRVAAGGTAVRGTLVTDRELRGMLMGTELLSVMTLGDETFAGRAV